MALSIALASPALLHSCDPAFVPDAGRQPAGGRRGGFGFVTGCTSAMVLVEVNLRTWMFSLGDLTCRI